MRRLRLDQSPAGAHPGGIQRRGLVRGPGDQPSTPPARAIMRSADGFVLPVEHQPELAATAPPSPPKVVTLELDPDDVMPAPKPKPPRPRTGGAALDPEVRAALTRLWREGIRGGPLAARLNAAGHRQPGGAPWSRSAVTRACRAIGLDGVPDERS